jgi:two-component system response regulator
MVLIIDDHDNDAALIKRILSKQVPPQTIRHVDDGDEAIALLGDCAGETLELVLLDLHLPKGQGLEVLKQLRASPHARHVPVVVMAGSADDDEVGRSYDLGANSVLRKDTDTEHSEYAIEQVGHYWLGLNQPYVLPGVKR